MTLLRLGLFHKKLVLLVVSLILIMTSIPIYVQGANACIPSTYSPEAQDLIKYNSIPTINEKGKKLNQKYLLNQMGVGEAIVVYGCPEDVSGNEQKKGMYNSSLQYRYLGWDYSGNVYYNWNFPRDSDVTKSVGKNWIKNPWDKPTGIEKRLSKSSFSSMSAAPSWLEKMLDPYDRNKTFLQSYNRIKKETWTGVTLLDYAIIQQAPSNFGPGIVQLWSQDSNGKWWYQMFDIPALRKIEQPPKLPDLIITKVVNFSDAWVNDTVEFKVTVKNIGKGDAKNFNIGVLRTEYTVEPIRNNTLLAGQEQTFTFNIKFNTKGPKKLLFTADSSNAVKETDETNNTYESPIMINPKNESSTPVAIISHFEGDSRTEPKISINPLFEPQLSDHLSYSPGKEAIIASEWKYTDPAGKTFNRQPYAKDFEQIGEYLVQLRVTNSANKVSEWATLKINVTKEPEPEPEIPPVPELKAYIEFIPPVIITGETSSLINRSEGLNGYSWIFSENLENSLPNTSDYEFHNITYNEPGSYVARIRVTDEYGGWKTDQAVLRVVDPKPIAIVSGITKVIQGRPLAYPHHLKNSYTPIADRGVTIDWSKSETRYKKEFSSNYTEGWFTETPSDLGKYILEGKVYDSQGRVSEWASFTMEVVPDQPPTVEIISPDEAYRTSGFNLYVDAESPDGDIIKYLKVEEKYDRDNDGNFEEEPWTTIYEGDFKALHAVNYTTVGKRQYKATVREDYGLESSSNIPTTDVLNYGPSVGFDVYGIIQQPGEDSTPPLIEFKPDTVLRSWKLVNPYSGGEADKVAWKSSATDVSTKNAVMANYDIKYPNSGNGPNARSKYSLASDIKGYPAWAVPAGETVIERIFAGNRLYTQRLELDYNSSTNTYNVYNFVFTERNSITGEFISEFKIDDRSLNLQFSYIGPDEKFYFLDMSEKSTNFDKINISVFDKTGAKIDQISYNRQPGSDPKSNYGAVSMEASPDGSSLYIFLSQGYNYVDDNWFGQYDIKLHVYKYNLKNRYLEWEVSSELLGRGGFQDISITHANNGDLYFVYRHKQTYSTNADGYIMKVKPNGVRSIVNVAGDSISQPTLSDDGNRLYITSASVSGQYNYGQTLYMGLYTLDVAGDQFRIIRNEKLEHIYDNWGYLYDEIMPTPAPIVMPDGRVLVVPKYGDDGWYDYNGVKLSDVSIYQAMKYGKMLLQSDGKIVAPSLATTNYSDYSMAIYDVLRGTIIVQTPVDSRFQSNGCSICGVNKGMASPILPDGSMYIFIRDSVRDPITNELGRLVIPFASAKGSGGINPIGADTIEITGDNWGGLLYDASTKAKNYALEFNVSVNDLANAKTVGAAIQIQDAKNMYALEWTKDTMTLYKVVNGAKTKLQSINRARTAFAGYNVKLESVNGVQRVFINQSKVIEVTDRTFTTGYAGIMSIGQPNASFSNLKKHNYGDTYVDQSYEAVLINDPVMYETIFSDIEKDPIGSIEWSYSHNPNFFENPLGLSMYHGLTQSTTVNAFDKPGVYDISYRAKDRLSLPSYEIWSEVVTKKLYVHRRPEALPDVRFTGKVYPEGEALDYETYDASYDPDVPVILSEKRFRTRWGDETNWTMGKRQYYNRPGVDLIIQEQVRDIHGAWSYWGETVVYKPRLPVVNQTKPVMTITYPTGTTATAPTVLVDEPLIRWTYYDRDNDPQELYRLVLTYVDNGETAFYGEFAGNDTSYQIPNDWIEDGRVVSVQGQVYSAGIWSDMSNFRYFLLDLPPKTYLTSYNGASLETPVYTNSNRPVLSVFTVDPENHPIRAIDYEVFRVSDLETVVDTNSLTAATSYTPSPLAEGMHYWRARAFDSYIWGLYSTNGFFFVDTVKPLDVNEQLEIEPTSVTVRFNTFSDPAPSSGHARRGFFMHKVNADGSLTNIDLDGNGSTEFNVWIGKTDRSYRVNGLVPGNQYRLTVVDYDVAGNEGHLRLYLFLYESSADSRF